MCKGPEVRAVRRPVGRCGGFASEMDEGLRRVWSREDGRDVVCSSLWLFPSSKVNPQNCHSRRRARPGAAQLARDQSSGRWIPAVNEDFGEPAAGRTAGTASGRTPAARPHRPAAGPGWRLACPHSWFRVSPVDGQVSQKTGKHPPKTNQQNLCFSFSVSQHISSELFFFLINYLHWLF